MSSEFDFIQNIKKKYGLDRVGDDCAVLPKDNASDLVVTTDMLVEDIDFRLEWTVPELLGHKALAVSLSDIAAMGGRPKWAMLTIGVPEKLWQRPDFLDLLYDGWHRLARRFGVELVGGDISRTPDKLVIDSMAAGEVRKGEAILRSGARVGDAIAVTGRLGGAAGGLALLEGGEQYRSSNPSVRELILRQLSPDPPSLEPLFAAGVHPTSMIDLSDGLSSDLFHICGASGVGARIFAEQLPVDERLNDRFTAEETFEFALNGGEDLELLFTIPPADIPLLENSRVTVIGEITSETGTIDLIRGGTSHRMTPAGFRHF